MGGERRCVAKRMISMILRRAKRHVRPRTVPIMARLEEERRAGEMRFIWMDWMVISARRIKSWRVQKGMRTRFSQGDLWAGMV